MTKQFAIAPKQLTSDMITLSPATFTYDGTSKKPDVTVKYNGIALTTDECEITNGGGTDAGTYYVTVSKGG